MKKLFIKKRALLIRRASLALRKSGKLEAIKLTPQQAYEFINKFRSFDEAVDYYGAHNVLLIGEPYTGYLLKWNIVPEVNFLTGGRLLLETERSLFNPELDKLIDEHRYLRVEKGDLQYVWDFYGCSDEMLSSVKEKIVKTLVSDDYIVFF